MLVRDKIEKNTETKNRFFYFLENYFILLQYRVIFFLLYNHSDKLQFGWYRDKHKGDKDISKKMLERDIKYHRE